MNSSPLKRRFPGSEDENMYPAKKPRIVFYLDDYTPIRTIQVTNLEDHVCAGYLRAYFECKVGPVCNVTVDKLKLERCDEEIRVGYVTFVMPEDAARSMFDRNLQPNCKFTIKRADDDHQPKIDPNASKFVDLNDDCLMHITSFLNLIDTINLGETCRRLRSFAETEIYSKRTVFTFGTTDHADVSTINRKNFPKILEAMGKHLKTVTWINLTDRQMDQLTQYCKNVIALKLVAPNLHLNSIDRNKHWFSHIETLIIENADFYDIHAMSITTSTHLKSLQFINCCNIRGDFLSNWKDSPVKYLRVLRCQGLSSSNITDFQRTNQLVKFSSDTYDSFITCLTLPAPILSNFTELELAVNSSTDEKLGLLKLDELQQLKKIQLKSTFFHVRMDRDVTVTKNFNNVFVAMNPIHSLTSITVQHIIVDADTFRALRSIQNLRELSLKNIHNRVGEEMYLSLHAHLPKLTKLSMSDDDSGYYSAICQMVSGLVDLTYFSHSSMTWGLLNMILNDRCERKQPPIEVGIMPMMFNSRKKKVFAESQEATVTLSLIK